MLPFDAQRYSTSYFIDGTFRTNAEMVGNGKRLYTSVARVFSPLSHNRFFPYQASDFVFPGYTKEQIHATFVANPHDSLSLTPPQKSDELAKHIYLINEASSFDLILSIIEKVKGYQYVSDPIMDKWRRRLEGSISLQLKLPGGKTVMGALSPNGSLTQPPPSYGPGREREMIDRIARNTLQQTHSLFKLVDTLIEEDRLEPVSTD